MYNDFMKIESTLKKTTKTNALKAVNKRRFFDDDNSPTVSVDHVIIEEPLLISLNFVNTNQQSTSIDLTMIMRTPGFDKELVIGFLFSEHIITRYQDVLSFDVYDVDNSKNHVDVTLAKHVQLDLEKITRNFTSQSSCGICGKSSLKALALHSQLPMDDSATGWLKKTDIIAYAKDLKSRQPLFSSTGGVHGAGYVVNKKWLCVHEDVGRHNAVDKIIGDICLTNNFSSLSVLVLSGRVSFELMQKAITAGISVVIAIGAPSSLAVSAAIQFNITLIGFTKENQFNVYSASHRVIDT
jgi:FdhD protein